MYKFIVLFAVVAYSSAQILNLNPLTLGTTAPAGLQTINLAATRLGLGYGGLGYGLARPWAGRYAVAAPQVAIAAPQIAYAAAPRIITAPQAIAYGNPGLEGPPQPYTFGFTSADEFGTQLGRQEQADGSGAVTGSYSLAEADGRQRVVNYVADAAGFRATVQTNEPGTANANPADVIIQSSAPSKR